MKSLLDTSVLVAAVIQSHVFHQRALAVLQRVQNGQEEGVVSAHTLAEMYAIMTKLPTPLRHSPEQAWLSIEENVIKYFSVSGLTGADYIALVRDAALTSISGGTIYDAVLMKCAIKEAVDRAYTLNLRHFQSVAPKAMLAKICEP